jgi:hypothetical protein
MRLAQADQPIQALGFDRTDEALRNFIRLEVLVP